MNEARSPDDNGLDRSAGLFPALLKHWRRKAALSQLDLALSSNVSARHISFLETGRSNPSSEMVLILASALGVHLRQTNHMLRAAGHPELFQDNEPDLPEAVLEALDLIKTHHEPYPVIIMDQAYNHRDMNRAAGVILGKLLGAPAPQQHTTHDTQTTFSELNLARLTLDPNGAARVLVNFEEVGRELLWRIHREVLADPDDGQMSELLNDLTSMPTVDPDWRRLDPSAHSDPALVLHFRTEEIELKFLATVAAFQAPHHVEVERLRIETWFPYDTRTTQECQRWAQDG